MLINPVENEWVRFHSQKKSTFSYLSAKPYRSSPKFAFCDFVPPRGGSREMLESLTKRCKKGGSRFCAPTSLADFSQVFVNAYKPCRKSMGSVSLPEKINIFLPFRKALQIQSQICFLRFCAAPRRLPRYVGIPYKTLQKGRFSFLRADLPD